MGTLSRGTKIWTEIQGDLTGILRYFGIFDGYLRQTKRPDALFSDPLAEALAGTKGEGLSANFENMAATFSFTGWPEFHKTWVAVRTRFIDDAVAEHAAGGTLPQLVNLGAGMDTRPYRLESYKAFTNGAFGTSPPHFIGPNSPILACV